MAINRIGPAHINIHNPSKKRDNKDNKVMGYRGRGNFLSESEVVVIIPINEK